jgi:hypothetical protein
MPHGTQLVAAMDSMSTGYGKWENKKLHKKLRPIICPPKIDRNDLDDNDIAVWPLDDKGEPDDPWKAMSAILFANAETGIVYSFETMTLGGRKALDKLRLVFAVAYRHHSGEYPIIELGAESYQGRNGTNWNPTFNIVGWIDKTADNLGALPPPPSPMPKAAPALVNLSEPPSPPPPSDYHDGPGPDDLPDDEIPF